MNNESICPCDRFVFPLTITNRPGLNAIAYRVGDFTMFRHALLLPRAGEVELLQWRPNATQDLAVQMVEWWAYLADILTFYNERIANQDYLRTADLPESVNRLIRVLGYRPRPGIGATGTLAALLSKQLPLRLPQGLQIQSKPGPGQQPQIFELDADTTINPPDAVPVDPTPDPSLLQTDEAGRACVLLAGVVSNVKPGDELLLLEQGWIGTDDNWALAVVYSVSQQKDAHGNTNTQIAFTDTPLLPANPVVTNYRLLKSNQYARPWHTAKASITLTSNAIDLDSIVRAIKVGDPILFEVPRNAPVLQILNVDTSVVALQSNQGDLASVARGIQAAGSLLFETPSTPGPLLVSVVQYTEAIWYANEDYPGNPPDPSQVPIPILHSQITFTPNQTSNWPLEQLEVRYGWQDVGQLIPAPASALNLANPTLQATPPAIFPSNSGSAPVMIEDANGFGANASASIFGSPPTMQLSGLPGSAAELTPPLRVLYGLMQVSRGKTVASEILGSGDATQAGQEFVLKNSPLTYLLNTLSSSGQNYRSTLVVRIDGVAWQEVPSFYDQAPDAKVFATREDENNQTHVMFGDGINGARLTSGINNVVATYRYGSGASSPPAGSLTVILQPQPNLKAVRNPVAVGGGADPDPPAQIRRYAPQSVLTFGRAISADDYETIAAQAPGVARARSYWAWDPDQQRALVTIYVGDDASAVTAAQTAIALADDPNRPVVVKLAVPVPVRLSMTLLVDPKYDVAAVTAGVRSALLDTQTGLLGASLRIGQIVYNSQIYQACLSVPGVVAVHGLRFLVGRFVPLRFALFRAGVRASPTGFFSDVNESHSPGEGGFFQLTDDNLTITPEAASYAR